MSDPIPDLGNLPKPTIEVVPAVMLAQRSPDMPDALVTASDIVFAIGEHLRPIVRQEIEQALAAHFGVQVG